MLYLSRSRWRAIETAFAAWRFRLSKDRLPDDLEELVPEYLNAVPSDPFTGDALRYRRTDDGLVVYSLGANVTDDGRDRTGEPTGDDIGFRIQLPQ